LAVACVQALASYGGCSLPKRAYLATERSVRLPCPKRERCVHARGNTVGLDATSCAVSGRLDMQNPRRASDRCAWVVARCRPDCLSCPPIILRVPTPSSSPLHPCATRTPPATGRGRPATVPAIIAWHLRVRQPDARVFAMPTQCWVIAEAHARMLQMVSPTKEFFVGTRNPKPNEKFLVANSI
jgi:hypothetical protein